jgi:antitoxin Phd
MANWRLENAKNNLDELIACSDTRGPQFIEANGCHIAVVLSIAEYRALQRNVPDLRKFLLGGPKVDDFEIERDRSIG